MTNTKVDLNPIKTKFSKAYLHAIAAKANLILSETILDVDHLGIDFSVYKHPTNSIVGNSMSNEVKIQLKASSINSDSMLQEDADNYIYTLGKQLTKYGNMYLVLVVLPDDRDLDSWLTQDCDKLTIYKCGYYIKMTSDLHRGKITFPKANILTPQALIDMFDIDRDNIL